MRCSNSQTCCCLWRKEFQGTKSIKCLDVFWWFHVWRLIASDTTLGTTHLEMAIFYFWNKQSQLIHYKVYFYKILKVIICSTKMTVTVIGAWQQILKINF